VLVSHSETSYSENKSIIYTHALCDQLIKVPLNYATWMDRNWEGSGLC